MKRVWATVLIALLVSAWGASAATSNAGLETTDSESDRETVESPASGTEGDPTTTNEAEGSPSTIESGHFAVRTVEERVATNRVFGDAAFDSIGEEDAFEAKESPSTSPMKAVTGNPFQDAAQQAGQAGSGGQQAQTGTDPRDFAGKVMPYYRFTKLSNGMKTQDFTLFGMWDWSKKAALTYEIPFARYYDIRGTEACASLEETGECFGDVPGGGTDFFPRGFEGRGLGEIAGMGDSIFRMIFNFDNKILGAGFLPGLDMTFPTATEAVLGGQTFTAGPIFTFVWDLPFWPAPGAFFAQMNIFQIDVWKDPERDDVNRYLGRWFLMFPVQKSHKLYVLIEMQPVYDWEGDHFSFWMGPEFGKAFGPGEFFRNGGALYVKPGFGIRPNSDFGDRETSFEFGFRYFLNPTQSVMDLIR